MSLHSETLTRATNYEWLVSVCERSKTIIKPEIYPEKQASEKIRLLHICVCVCVCVIVALEIRISFVDLRSNNRINESTNTCVSKTIVGMFTRHCILGSNNY